MRYSWTTPAGSYSNLADIITNQVHTLIAGTTGSGKSVLLHSIINRLLYNSPERTKLILLDMKCVSLAKYRKLPHCVKYADTTENCERAIAMAYSIMNQRYRAMQREKIELYQGADLFIIIDEFVDIKQFCTKETERLLSVIASKGRAARLHIILCTQRPTRDIITGLLKNNFDCAAGLRTRTKQESINIIGRACCETLPRVGYCYLDIPGYTAPELWKVELISDTEQQRIIDHWTRQQPKRHILPW